MRRSRYVLAAVMVLAACGGGADPGTTPTAADPADGSDASASATAEQIEPGTEASTAGAGDGAPWTEFDGRVDLAIGHALRTDATGFAEVRYEDGSLTRLDVATTLEVVALAGGPAQSDVSVRMDIGRTWNRVQDVAGGGRFEVETSVATAAVRGTAFIVACTASGGCAFTVVEGTLEVTAGDVTVTLTAFQRVEVGPDGDVGEVEDLAPADVLADEWVVRNAERDDAAGFAPLDGGDGDAGASGGDGPAAGDGRAVTAGTVLASSDSSSTLVRPDGTTATVPLGFQQLFTGGWFPDGSIGWTEQGQLMRMLPDGSGSTTVAGPGVDIFSTNLRGDMVLGMRPSGGGTRIVLSSLVDGEVAFQQDYSSPLVEWPAISPDGSTIAAMDFDGEAFLLIDVASGQMTSRAAPGIAGWLRWSPDGTRVVYVTNRGGVQFAGEAIPIQEVVVHDVASGSEQRFSGFMEADFTPDGAALIAAAQDTFEQPPGSLMRIDLSSGATTEYAAGSFGAAIVFHGATFAPGELSLG